MSLKPRLNSNDEIAQGSFIFKINKASRKVLRETVVKVGDGIFV